MRIKRIIISMMVMAMAINCMAYDFVVNGNAYNINNDGKTLTLRGFVGDLDTLKNFVIPDYVVYNDVSYDVIDVYQTWFQEIELDELYFGRNVKYLNSSALTDCGTVKHVIWNSINCEYYDIITSYLSPSPISIGGRSIDRGIAELNTTEVESVVIGDGVETLPFPFMTGAKISSLYIPASITEIDGSNFYSCEELATVIVDDNNPLFDSRSNCNGVVRTDNNTLVMACSSTKIPTSVTAISSMAFLVNITAKEINLPSSISKIDSDAFQQCTALEKITVNNPNPDDISLGYNVFGYEDVYNEWTGVPVQTCVLRVPKGSVSLYKNADQWKQFKRIEEMINTSIDDVNIIANDGIGSFYDMQGRRVAEPTQPGIYIHDGKKVIVN